MIEKKSVKRRKTMKRKINGQKILKKIPVKAGSNVDIDHLLITDKNIYAITVTGKRYWNLS